MIKKTAISSTLGVAVLASSFAIAQKPTTEPQEESFAPDDKSLTCALEALNQVDIKDSKLSSFNNQYGDGTQIFTLHKGYSENFSDNGHNTMSARISIDEKNKITFSTNHDGTLDRSVVDASRTNITIETSDNTVIERSGAVHAEDRHDFDNQDDWVNRSHTQWTIKGAQTLEYSFTQCMNLDYSNEAQRIEGAAMSVDQAPSFMELKKE